MSAHQHVNVAQFHTPEIKHTDTMFPNKTPTTQTLTTTKGSRGHKAHQWKKKRKTTAHSASPDHSAMKKKIKKR